MAIDVICTGCKSRFQVSEKFAGKQGPCPKCKTVITIPAKGEEVTVHAPESYGPKTASGEAVFKPIKRKQTKYTPIFLGAVGLGVFAVFMIAIVLRIVLPAADPDVAGTRAIIMALGAFLIAPPIVVGGYTFLRDAELDPYRGKALWIRTAACSGVYGLLWIIFSFLVNMMFGGEALDAPTMLMAVIPFVGLGGLAAFASLDLQPMMAGIHFGFYLAVCVILRLILGMPAFGPLSFTT